MMFMDIHVCVQPAMCPYSLPTTLSILQENGSLVNVCYCHHRLHFIEKSASINPTRHGRNVGTFSVARICMANLFSKNCQLFLVSHIYMSCAFCRSLGLYAESKTLHLPDPFWQIKKRSEREFVRLGLIRMLRTI